KANRAPAVVAFVAAAIGAGVGTAFGLASLSKHNDASGHCNGNACDATGVQLRSDARRAGDISTVAFLAGGAALVGGGVLWVTAPPPSSGNAASIGVGGRF